MTIRVEALTDADIARCVELENALFAGDDPWTAIAFRAELSSPHTHYFAARSVAEELVGYAGIALLGSASDPESEVHTIAVDPAVHRTGAGTATDSRGASSASQRCSLRISATAASRRGIRTE